MIFTHSDNFHCLSGQPFWPLRLILALATKISLLFLALLRSAPFLKSFFDFLNFLVNFDHSQNGGHLTTILI